MYSFAKEPSQHSNNKLICTAYDAASPQASRGIRVWGRCQNVQKTAIGQARASVHLRSEERKFLWNMEESLVGIIPKYSRFK